MARNYLDDPDLVFLEKAENSDLEPLVAYLKNAITEELTLQEEFKAHGQDYQAYIREIIHELQLYGGNTFANILRGIAELPPISQRENNEIGELIEVLNEFLDQSSLRLLLPERTRRVLLRPFLSLTKVSPNLDDFRQGIPYEKILHLVCKRLKVKIERTDSIPNRERALLERIADESIEQMTVDEITVLVEDSLPKGQSIPAKKNQLIAAAQVAIRSTGFTPYKMSVVVANGVAKQVLGRGLSLTANATLTKSLSVFAGPVGLVVNGILTANSLAAPAYRVIVPACCQISYLRMKYLN